VTSPPEDGPQQPIQHLADEPARAFRGANREIGRPVLSLRTDDCQRDAERLKAARPCCRVLAKPLYRMVVTDVIEVALPAGSVVLDVGTGSGGQAHRRGLSQARSRRH
jgi:hypothetical protein